MNYRGSNFLPWYEGEEVTNSQAGSCVFGRSQWRGVWGCDMNLLFGVDMVGDQFQRERIGICGECTVVMVGLIWIYIFWLWLFPTPAPYGALHADMLH